MAEYQVRITEILVRETAVEAKNADDAHNIVQQQYWDEKIVLDTLNFCDVEFEVI